MAQASSPVPSAIEAGPGAESAGRRDLNRHIARRQKMLLAGIGGTALALGTLFLFSGQGEDESGSSHATTIEAEAMVNRDLADREFVAVYGNRLAAQGRAIADLQENQARGTADLRELDDLRNENARMVSDGQAAIDALSAENEALRGQLGSAQAAPSPGPATSEALPLERALPLAGEPSGPDAGAPGVTLLSFDNSSVSRSPAQPADGAPPLLLEANRDYLPPNSYAPAVVIVGVDASTGVASQSDPLPVVLRITGPARSVIHEGKALVTDLSGCLVNGAARGELSSEKVYVKLLRMTCAQPGGRFAISEVKGFVAFAGKSGVRGRVVSREGSLVGQALLAGVIGGFGRGLSSNAAGTFARQVDAEGKPRSLSATDILTGGLGQGAGDAADTVSKYLIERAEQYQPVVEMPTGIAVEIVFLDGVQVRSIPQ